MANGAALIKFESTGSVTVGTLEGTDILDQANVTDFGLLVLDFIKNKTDLNLLLDFSAITYMSSAALTELLRINQALRSANGTVRLCSLTTDIGKVFKITNLDALFGIHDGEDKKTATERFERALTVAAEEDAWATTDSSS